MVHSIKFNSKVGGTVILHLPPNGKLVRAMRNSVLKLTDEEYNSAPIQRVLGSGLAIDIEQKDTQSDNGIDLATVLETVLDSHTEQKDEIEAVIPVKDEEIIFDEENSLPDEMVVNEIDESTKSKMTTWDFEKQTPISESESNKRVIGTENLDGTNNEDKAVVKKTKKKAKKKTQKKVANKKKETVSKLKKAVAKVRKDNKIEGSDLNPLVLDSDQQKAEVDEIENNGNQDINELDL